MPIIVNSWAKAEERAGGSCVGGCVGECARKVVGWGVFLFLLGLGGVALVVRSVAEGTKREGRTR